MGEARPQDPNGPAGLSESDAPDVVHRPRVRRGDVEPVGRAAPAGARLLHQHPVQFRQHGARQLERRGVLQPGARRLGQEAARHL